MARALFGARLCGHRVLLVTGGLAGSNGLLDIFEREKQLVRIEAFRAAPELRASQLAQQVPWVDRFAHIANARNERDVDTIFEVLKRRGVGALLIIGERHHSTYR